MKVCERPVFSATIWFFPGKITLTLDQFFREQQEQKGYFADAIFFHRLSSAPISRDHPNLFSFAGLLPVMILARKAGLQDLVDECVKIPTGNGAKPGLKTASLAAGMVPGAAPSTT